MAGKPINILLVEDELTYAQAVTEMLSASCGFHITHARCFQEAEACLEKNPSQVQAALLDLMLPDNEGLKTFTDLNARFPNLPVIVITGMADETLALRAMREGAQDYLVKGQVDGRTLERSIRYAIERRRADNAVLERKATVETLREALADVKRAHEELKATQLKLVQAEKLEAVSTFAAGVAHEVRNPLQTLLMGLEYLDKHVHASDRSVAMVLQEMVHAVRRADGIIRGLTDFAQHSKRDLREEDLAAILKHAIAAVEPELNQHPILLSQELGENLPSVMVDFRSLKHVFINLLMRVIRALQPEGGRIVVRCFASRLERALVLNGKGFRNFQPNDELLWGEVEVFPNRLPEGATTVRSNSSGLGFTVLKKIIELYTGVFEVTYPEDTGGTRYVVVFKSAKAAATQAA